jgi:hypothetical protein
VFLPGMEMQRAAVVATAPLGMMSAGSSSTTMHA